MTISVLHTDKGFTVVVQSLSSVPLSAAPWPTARQAFLSFTVSRSLLRLVSIKSVMPSNHLNLCHPLLLLPSIFPSIRVFLSESAFHIRWPKYWSFSINPSNEYSRLIFFQINWFDLLAVQRTLKSLPQHHNLKASILCCSAFNRFPIFLYICFFLSPFSTRMVFKKINAHLTLTSIHDYWQNHSFD